MSPTLAHLLPASWCRWLAMCSLSAQARVVLLPSGGDVDGVALVVKDGGDFEVSAECFDVVA